MIRQQRRKMKVRKLNIWERLRVKTKRYELPYGIETSKNLIQFRENLLKYFYGDKEGKIRVNYSKEDWINVDVEELSDINDIRKYKEETPWITPKWNLKKDITDWIIDEIPSGRWDNGRKLEINPSEFFTDENNFDMIEDNTDWVNSDSRKECWSLENETLCSFLPLVFGKYSGTSFSMGVTNLK